MRNKAISCALVFLAGCGVEETLANEAAEETQDFDSSATGTAAPLESSSPPLQRLELRRGARPAGVPADFVLTPQGFAHPSCVYRMEPGERPEGHAILGLDGSARAKPPCAHPRFDARGKQTMAPRAASATSAAQSYPQPGTGEMWDVWAYDQSQGPIGHLQAKWRVPYLPVADRGTLIYLFSGLISTANPFLILQNVLAWRGDGWVIESWQADDWGNSIASPSLSVHTGDVIVGYIDGLNCDSTGYCPTWKIRTVIPGVNSTWAYTSAFGLRFNRIYGGVLEDDGLECVKFGPITFYDIWARKVPSWTWVAPNLRAGFDPDHDCTRSVGGSAPVPGSPASVSITVGP